MLTERFNSPMERAKGGHRVLAIDDNERLLKSCREFLSRSGFSVTTCSDSAQVVPLLKAHDYDVALLDIRMPGLEGTDLLPLIKKVQPELPVILISAYCDEGAAGYYHALGAFETMSKPFSHEALLDAVTRAIQRQERIPVVLATLSLREARDQVYRKLILAALRKTNWNQLRAAELLGVSRYCLIRWIKKLGIAY